MHIKPVMPHFPPETLLKALESWPVGVMVTDALLDPPGPHILYVNRAFTQMTGYEMHELLGKTPRILQGPDTSRVVLGQVRDALRQGEEIQTKTVNYRKDGTPFIMQWSMSPIGSTSETPEFFIAFQRDVTEEQRVEALAAATNLADNIGFLFSSIRHELGNPVNSVKAAVTLLRTNLESQPLEQTKGMIDRVLEEIKRIEFLLRGLRSFSAFEDVVLEDLHLSEFLKRFFSSMGPECERKHVTLRLVEESVDVLVRADPRALYQVLLNLVSNALEAFAAQRADEDGVLDRRFSPQILIRTTRGFSGTVLLSVADNGPGIPEDRLQRVFQPFYTTKATGSGLGLSIVRKLLARMGAGIEVRSYQSPDQGIRKTTFTVDLQTADTLLP